MRAFDTATTSFHSLKFAVWSNEDWRGDYDYKALLSLVEKRVYAAETPIALVGTSQVIGTIKDLFHIPGVLPKRSPPTAPLQYVFKRSGAFWLLLGFGSAFLWIPGLGWCLVGAAFLMRKTKKPICGHCHTETTMTSIGCENCGCRFVFNSPDQKLINETD